MTTADMPKKRAGTGRPLTVYLKPSDYCNVGCSHCYLPVAVRANKFKMTTKVFDSALKTVAEMEKRQNAPGSLIVWHGGEPLSLQVDYLTHLAEETQRALPTCIQSLQTSLIPYSEKWKNIVSDHFGSEIGTSVDFTQRTLKGSPQAYLSFWMTKVTLARQHGYKVIPGMVPSTGEMGKGKEIAQWFEENGFRHWNIDRYNQFAGVDPLRPNNKAHSQFLSEVFDAIMDLARQKIYTQVNTVKAALNAILFNMPGERWGGSCSHDFLVINPDGQTHACPDKISHEGFSNITQGFDAFQASPERKAWIRKHLLGHQNTHCATCPFQTFCRSGCPLTPNDPESEGECSGYHRHLRHVQEFCTTNRHLAMEYLEATQ